MDESEDVPVALAAGEAASGLAQMTGLYLQQTLADSAAKRRQARSLRGRLGLQTVEGDVAITLAFDGGGISIEEGLVPPIDAYIGGPFQLLMEALGGQANPYLEVLRRRLRVRPSLRRPLFALRAYNMMRLPRPAGPARAGRPWLWAILAAGLVAGALLLIARRGSQGEE